MKSKWIASKVILLSLWASTSAFALDNFNPINLGSLFQPGVDALIKTVALGTDYRSYTSARPLGMLLGIDAGIDLTVITVPTDFKTAMSTATGQPQTAIPNQIPLPRMTFRKGLPKGIDLGFSLLPDYQGLFKSYGASVQWAPGLMGPTLDFAVRLSGNYTKLYFLATRCYSIDAVVSKKFFVFDPYMGLGFQMWSGDLQTSVSPQVGVSGSQSGLSPHFFGGLGLKMLIIKLAGEFNYSTEGVTTWGLKASLNF